MNEKERVLAEYYESLVAIDLESLSVGELKAKAKDLGIEGYSNLKKDELIAAIREV